MTTNEANFAAATQQTIADVLGVSRSTISRRMKADPEAVKADYIAAMEAFSATVKKPTPAPTQCPAQVANGLRPTDTVHARRSLAEQRGQTVPADSKPKKAPKAAPKAPRAEAKGIINTAGRVVLKTNKTVRAELKAAAVKQNGTRLLPEGFDSFTDFLGGFDMPKNGNKEIAFKVAGASADEGAKVVLTISQDGSYTID